MNNARILRCNVEESICSFVCTGPDNGSHNLWVAKFLAPAGSALYLLLTALPVCAYGVFALSGIRQANQQCQCGGKANDGGEYA